MDGLDECANHDHQQKILQLFIQAFQAGQLPLRLLVASRPEPHIRDLLEGEGMPSLCRHVLLSADKSAYDDIRTFLRAEFSRIRDKFVKKGVGLEKTWPSEETLEHLVKKSSGIFVYAKTVICFIDDEYVHPADRLASVLSLDPSSTAPLDDLYTQILSVLSHEPEELRILHAIAHPNGLYSDPEDADTVLGLRPGRMRLMLRALHSLFKVLPRENPRAFHDAVYCLHASFTDFLCDERRCGKWCIEIPSLHRDFLKSIIRFLSNPDFIDRIDLRR
jgi:hypothetical protein